MRYIKKIQFKLLLSLIFCLGIVSTAHAYIIPTLSLLDLNNGTVQVTVMGDPNQTVQLYYNNTGYNYNNYNYNNGYNSNQYNLGYTNNSGYLYTTLNSSQYNIPVGASVYVMVDGLQSQMISWPSNTNNYNNNYNYNNGYYNNTYYPYSYSPVYFSQNNVSLTQGQSTTVILSGGSGSYYVSGSAEPVLDITINGSVMNIYARTTGGANVVVCSSGYTSSCSTLIVSVTGSYYQPYYYPTYYPTYPTYQTPQYQYPVNTYNNSYQMMYHTYY